MPSHKRNPTPKDNLFERGRQLLQDAENSTNPEIAKLRAKAAKRYFDADLKDGSEMSTNPLIILKSAIKAVPAVKYALGIGGIVAVVAIVKSFGLGFKVAAFGTIVMIVLMSILLLFATAAGQKSSHPQVPALVFTWFCLMLFMAV